jgi:flagellar hook-associated protein 3 FlgL
VSTRVTSEMMIGSSLADINNAQLALQRSQRELSSGRSILEPSDNPTGASQAIVLQSTIDGLVSYEHGVNDGIGWLNAATGALSSMNQLAQRAHDLLLQASNGINSQADLENIASEVEQITETVKQTANTQYAGQFIFSGSLTATAPYNQGASDAYHGNAGSITRTVGPGANVNVNVSLVGALGEGLPAKDGKLLDTLRTIAQHLREGGPAARAMLGNEDLARLNGNMNTLFGLSAQVGAATDQLKTSITRIEDMHTAATAQLSNVQDANFAQVAMEFSNQKTAFESALRASASIVQQSLLDFLR